MRCTSYSHITTSVAYESKLINRRICFIDGMLDWPWTKVLTALTARSEGKSGTVPLKDNTKIVCNQPEAVSQKSDWKPKASNVHHCIWTVSYLPGQIHQPTGTWTTTEGIGIQHGVWWWLRCHHPAKSRRTRPAMDGRNDHPNTLWRFIWLLLLLHKCS